MATDRRVARVAESIKREVSQLLISGIKDDRVGVGMVSVTDVEVSGDLQHAKIFVSIYGTEEARAATMAGLKSATGYVRSVIGQQIRLRRTPEVVFIEDRSIERGTQVLSLLSRLSEERKASGREDEWEDLEASGKVAPSRDEEDFEEDDLDEDVVDEYDDDFDPEFDLEDEDDDFDEDDLDDDRDDEASAEDEAQPKINPR